MPVLAMLASTDSSGLAFTGIVLVVLGLLVAAIIGVNVWAAIDAGRRPDWAFRDVGTKILWILLPSPAGAVLALVCCWCSGVILITFPGMFLCLIPAGLWFFMFRKKVQAAEAQGPQGGFGGGFGGPPGGGFGGPPGGGYGGPPPGGGYGGPPPGGGYGAPPPGGGYPPPPGGGFGTPPPGPPPGGFPPPGGPPGGGFPAPGPPPGGGFPPPQ